MNTDITNRSLITGYQSFTSSSPVHCERKALLVAYNILQRLLGVLSVQFPEII